MLTKNQAIRDLQEIMSRRGPSRQGRGRRYPKELKNKLIELMAGGHSLVDLSRMTGVPSLTLRSWKHKHLQTNFQKLCIPDQPAKSQVRLHLSENIWLELDPMQLTPSLIRTLRSVS